MGLSQEEERREARAEKNKKRSSRAAAGHIGAIWAGTSGRKKRKNASNNHLAAARNLQKKLRELADHIPSRFVQDPSDRYWEAFYAQLTGARKPEAYCRQLMELQVGGLGFW